MVSEKVPSQRVAYGLPPNPEAYLSSAQDVQSIFAKGLRPDGSYKPEMVLALLKFRRVNVTVLAETHGYSEGYFRHVINRLCHDVDVENVIAAQCGVAPDRMWGRQLVGEVAHAS